MRRFTLLITMFALLASVSFLPQQAATATSAQNDKNITAENVAESVIYVYGTRPALEQVRRNGIERGRMTRTNSEGRTEESSYVRSFIRGENSAKDKIRIDQKSPTVEYAMVYGEGRTWGIINGASFTPREESIADFLSQKWHNIDALLRYKEDGSTITLVGKDKQMGVDLHVLDLTDKENHRTRYYISAKTLRVLSLEYELAPAGGGGKPVKFTKRFYDYRIAQGTLVPYRTVLYENGKQMQETRLLTITYGIKMEDSVFHNPDSPTTTTTTTQP
ncbi:MAG TPA: hypothetical protein VF708_19485 [Pyrinomonadaceae bacterium]